MRTVLGRAAAVRGGAVVGVRRIRRQHATDRSAVAWTGDTDPQLSAGLAKSRPGSCHSMPAISQSSIQACKIFAALAKALGITPEQVPFDEVLAHSTPRGLRLERRHNTSADRSNRM